MNHFQRNQIIIRAEDDALNYYLDGWDKDHRNEDIFVCGVCEDEEVNEEGGICKKCLEK